MGKAWIALPALLTLAAVPALAQRDFDDDGDRDRDRNNTEGFYLGAGIGDFSTEIDEIDDVDDADLDFDEDEDASKIFAGWRFNRFFAVQADYYDFGNSNTALNLLPIEAETKGFAPTVVGTLPLGPVELFARAGLMFYDVSLSLDNDEIIDESGNDPVYSAGIGFTIFDRLNLKAEYEVIDIEEFDEAEAVWLHANWRF